jgi:two-component system phosphate regulon response regulator OmpR
MMPHESGLEFARSLRSESQVPILMLTARAEPEQRIEGLETGVDDYLAKPFDPRELLLRVANVLRRGVTVPASGEVHMGNFVFHISRGELRRDGEAVRLTERERELLRYFAQRPGMPVSRHELAKSADSGGERAVDVQINRLRRKIEHDPANPVYLQTVRGKGYILYSE